MVRITLLDKCKWNNLYCNIHYNNNKNKRLFCSKLDSYTYFIDVENDVDYITFSNGKKKRTSRIYINGISKKFILKHNKKINKDMLYVYDDFTNGKLDTYLLYDKKNLKNWTNKKRIWIYKPSSYTNNKKYGLIISFDGQNAFYKNNMEKKNVYGGIQLDTYCEEINKKEDYLIVGIDNGTIYRDEELTMNQDFGKVIASDKKEDEGFYHGNLDLLLDFILEKVIPLLKKEYSIDESRIGLLGASSGGLASFYGTYRNPNIYSFAISLSPAFMFFERNAYKKFIEKVIKENNNLPKLYLYCGNKGKLEEKLLVSTIDTYNLLSQYECINEKMVFRVDKSANHNEIYWRSVINEALVYILK